MSASDVDFCLFVIYAEFAIPVEMDILSVMEGRRSAIVPHDIDRRRESVAGRAGGQMPDLVPDLGGHDAGAATC